jgi:osmotically-inducible protein OsmY
VWPVVGVDALSLLWTALSENGEMSPNYNRLVTATYDQRPLNDTLIARRAQERLRSSSYVSVQRLTCDVHEGMLTLRGRLPSFHTKQVALSLVAEVEGVEEIIDRVEVV